MAPSCPDVAASMLLCSEEDSSLLCFEKEVEVEETEAVGRKRGRSPEYGSDLGVDLFPPQSEECVADLVEKELHHMPSYGERLSGAGAGDGVDLGVRREAIDWIWKVYSEYNFRPLTAYLAVNYLDRFLSLMGLTIREDWVTQLLSLACVSLASKMEETAVPPSMDLQAEDTRDVFEPKIIKRMELLVLSTLKWRMHAVTPFSYMDYFLNKLNGGNAAPRSWVSQSAELILSAARGTCCIEFRPSEIAAAVAAAVVGEVNVPGIENLHIDQERVLQCQDAIQATMAPSAIDTVKSARGRTSGSSPVPPVPQSPVGVLDAAGCLSYKSEDDAAAAAVATVAAAASHGASASGSSSSSSPVTSKRRKLSSR